MDKLKVALFVKPSKSGATFKRTERNMGYWSYSVDEFDWHHYCPHGQVIHTSLYKDFDLIFWEDGGSFRFVKDGGPPIAYMAIDSTLSDEHYKTRLEHAHQSDLVLVDHDKLQRFKSAQVPVRRLNYCVNDGIFKPRDKELDVTFHCASGARKKMPGGVERNDMRQFLDDLCKRRRWTFSSGTLPLYDYAVNMGVSKVIVNVPRTVINRPHRVFDAMACKACLLTQVIPYVDGDNVRARFHYEQFSAKHEVEPALARLIEGGEWEHLASAGYNAVMSMHTWKVRAQQLREILHEELGI